MGKDKKVKTDFLILRVEADFKRKLVKAAQKTGQTVSEFVRNVLTGKM